MATVDLTLEVRNEGTNTAATNIMVSIPTPSGLTFNSVVSGSGYNDSNKTWTISSIAANSLAQIILRYTVVTGSSWSFTATINKLDQSDTTRSDNTVTVDISLWWLTDGIESSDVVAVYSPLTATSFSGSYVNVNNPGVHDLIPAGGVNNPVWDNVNGWTFTGAQWFDSDISMSGSYSVFCRYETTTDRTVQVTIFGVDYVNTSPKRHYNFRRPSGPTEPSKTLYYGVYGITCWQTGDDVMAFVRSSTAMNLYRGATGIVSGDYDINDFTTETMTLQIGKINSSGSWDNYYMEGNIKAFALYNTEFTETQAWTIIQNMQNL